jgi:hypothetical protein
MWLNERVKIIQCDMRVRELGLDPDKADFIKPAS